MMRKVYLDGELGEKFGKVFNVDVKSLRDFFNLLNANNSEFMPFLRECHEKGIKFFCKVGDTPIKQEEELLLNFNKGDMYISSVPAGSEGAAKIFVGALLIVAGAVLVVMSGGAAGLALYGGYAIAALGASLALMGLAELLAPDPGTEEGFEQDQSYLFQGAGQTIREGDPVPLLYGTLRVPGRLIDFDLRNARSNYIEPQGAAPASLNVEANSTSTASSPNASEILIGGSSIESTDIGGGINPQLPGQILSANIDETLSLTAVNEKFTFGELV